MVIGPLAWLFVPKLSASLMFPGVPSDATSWFRRSFVPLAALRHGARRPSATPCIGDARAASRSRLRRSPWVLCPRHGFAVPLQLLYPKASQGGASAPSAVVCATRDTERQCG